jgi:hypothetical protein
MWLQKNVEKWLPNFFGSKTYIWMKKYNIVVIIFNSNFESEMKILIPLCVHERKCAWKKYETKKLQSFWPFASYKWLNIVVFPYFLKWKVLFLQVLM